MLGVVQKELRIDFLSRDCVDQSGLRSRHVNRQLVVRAFKHLQAIGHVLRSSALVLAIELLANTEPRCVDGFRSRQLCCECLDACLKCIGLMVVAGSRLCILKRANTIANISQRWRFGDDACVELTILLEKRRIGGVERSERCFKRIVLL
jgi:hypothetical protein